MNRLAKLFVAWICLIGFPASSLAAVITASPSVFGSVRVDAPAGELLCGTAGATKTSGSLELQAVDEDLAGLCSMAFMQWDISSIPDDATILQTVFEFSVDSVSLSAEECDMVDMGSLTAGSSAAVLASALQSNAAYVSGFGPCDSVGNKSRTLGATANSDLQSLLSTDQFLLGLRYKDNHERPSMGTATTLMSNASLEVTFALEPASVPEPSTLMLMGIGLAGLGWMGRRKRV